MRIITSRKLRFYSKDRKQTFVTEGSNVIQECPDWAMNDDMFKAAKASGQLQILASNKEVKFAENEKFLAQSSHEAGKEKEATQESVEKAKEEAVDEEAAKKEAKKAARKARKEAKKQAEE